MCMELYLGSDNELPLVEWESEEKSPIGVRKLNCGYHDDDFANKYLTKRHKYSVGSWQGCGCGFTYDFSDALYEEEENIRAKQSVQELFKYIRDNVKGDECELLSFWTGDVFENEDIEYKDTIDLKHLVLGDSFEFLEGQYITIRV